MAERVDAHQVGVAQLLGHPPRELVLGGRVVVVADHQHRVLRALVPRPTPRVRVLDRPRRARRRVAPRQVAAEARHLALPLVRDGGHLGRAVVERLVRAVHGEVRVVARVRRVGQDVGPALLRAVLQRAERLAGQRDRGPRGRRREGRVPQFLEQLGQGSEVLRRVQHACHRAGHRGLVHHEAVRQRHRAFVPQVVAQRVVLLPRVPAERAPLADEVAALEEAVERQLEAPRALAVVLDAVEQPQRRVDVAVEDDRTRLLREHVDVGRAEQRAVREADVGQLAVADGLPHQVEVTGHVLGGHVLEQRACEPLAEAAVVLERLERRRLVRRGDRQRVHAAEDVGGVLLRGEAAQRGAAGDTARVETDQVEPVQHLWLEDVGAGLRHPVAGTARAAGVEEQRTHLRVRVRRRAAHQRDVDRAEPRPVVVERHREVSAAVQVELVGRHADELTGRTVTPGDLCGGLGNRGGWGRSGLRRNHQADRTRHQGDHQRGTTFDRPCGS